MERTFDWIPRHDPRSRQYGIREAIEPPRLHNRTWRHPPLALDQGTEGACVGFAWIHEAQNTPVAVDLVRVANLDIHNPDLAARHVYRQAQMVDEWEGVAYEGTSVLAGAHVMKSLGVLREYRWAFGIHQVRDAILTTGPAVLGINWYAGMYSAPGGVLDVSGEIVGGHALICNAYRMPDKRFDDEPAYGLFNSWGPDWGLDGQAWIRESDLARLLSENGEACVPYRRSYGR